MSDETPNANDALEFDEDGGEAVEVAEIETEQPLSLAEVEARSKGRGAAKRTGEDSPGTDEGGGDDAEKPKGAKAKPVAPGDDADAEDPEDLQRYLRATGKAPKADGKDAGGKPKAEGQAKGKDGPKPSGETPAQKPRDIGKTPEERAKYVSASRHLMKDGYTREDLDTLPVTTVLRLGEAAQKRHTEFWNASNELRRFKALEARQGDGRNRRTAPSDRRGTADDADPLDAVLNTDEDPGAGDDDRQQPQARPKAPETSQPGDELIDARKELVLVVFDAARNDLTKQYPTLSERSVRDRVGAECARLDPDREIALRGTRAEIDQLYRDAVLTVLGAPDPSKARSQRTDENNRLLDGQPHNVQRRPTASTRDLTPDEIDEITYKVSKDMAGKTRDEIKAEVRRRINAASRRSA